MSLIHLSPKIKGQIPGRGGGVLHPNWGMYGAQHKHNIWTLWDLTTSETDLKRVFGKFEIGGLKDHGGISCLDAEILAINWLPKRSIKTN